MKTHFWGVFFTFFSVGALAACSTEDPDDPKGRNAFSEAQMYYFYDEFIPGVGSYGIALSNGGQGSEFTELYLDFASDYFEDALRAVPTEGVYTFSESFARNTFNNRYSGYTVGDGSDERTFGLTGGRFSLSHTASGYLLRYGVELGDGSTLNGSYEGEIAGMYEPTLSADLKLDFDTMYDKTVEVAGRGGTAWKMRLRGNLTTGVAKNGEVGVGLMIHSGENSISLPEGRYLMADRANQGVKGTAEPASACAARIEGCYFVHSAGDISWAVPGDGFVEIDRNGEQYDIEFSFKDSNGYTVSGNYAGEIGAMKNG